MPDPQPLADAELEADRILGLALDGYPNKSFRFPDSLRDSIAAALRRARADAFRDAAAMARAAERGSAAAGGHMIWCYTADLADRFGLEANYAALADAAKSKPTPVYDGPVLLDQPSHDAAEHS